MRNDHWKAATILMAGLLSVTNAAQFYSNKIALSEMKISNSTQEEKQDAEMFRCQNIEKPSDAPEIKYLPGAFDKEEETKSTDKCIEHALIRKVDQTWKTVGSC